MANQLIIRAERCIGCRSCELACSLENESVLCPGKSRINVIYFSSDLYNLPYNIPFTCKQCIDAPCLRACPTGAIFQEKGESNIIKIRVKDCTGCRKCIRSCPFGAMFFDKDKKKAFKCELCNGKPACVRICPVEAISFKNKKGFVSKDTALRMEGYLILSSIRKTMLERKKQSAGRIEENEI